MSLLARLAPHLPYVRRYARALTGDQSTGDNYVRVALEALAAGDDLSSVQVEMDTKLDLAVAYQEIGDKEGARELIDEVIKGGTPEQVEKAKAMRTKLA